MKRIIFSLLLLILTPTTLTPRFFKKFRKSLTKQLKEAVCETIPLAQLIRESQEAMTDKEKREELKQIIKESREKNK